MMRSTKSWIPKLRPDQETKIVRDPRGRMLIPTPMLVARAIRRVPRGRLISAAQIRDRLARAADADLTCPMTTGIVLNIVAGATEESMATGGRAIAPYWRVTLPDGSLPSKFPVAPGVQARHLRAEGHRVVGRRVVEPAFVRR